MMKLIKKGILFVVILANLTAFAANDRGVVYLNGASITNAAKLTVVDQQYGLVFIPPSTPVTKESFITATLKYEESLLPIFGANGNTISDNFSLTVRYSILLEDDNGITTNKPSEKLNIDYNTNRATYRDLDVNRYEGYMKGAITITSVTLTENVSGSLVNHSVSNLPDDVYLELSVDVERYYPIPAANPASWTVYPQTINGNVVNMPNAQNELELSWDYYLGAESFDVEWVFVDITDDASGILASTQPYDWKDATRINTTNNYYNISLAYPSGMIIYRVRPVGIDLNNGNFDLIKTGEWSDLGATTNPNIAATTNKNGFIFLGLDGTKNWTYNVAYAEDGKRKEGISYYDGSARSRQEVTILNTDQNAIVGETMYDYEGRPGINMLPTPISSKGIGFYENGTTGIPFNSGYDKSNFDRNNVFDPGVGPDPMSGTAGVNLSNDYYSANNSSNSLYKDNVPDALNYPFARTTYKSDGTDRITEQSGVGDQLKHGTENTTKYFYGTPADMEIERLFGNEVGAAAFYQKNMVKDPNGQVSIQYLDKEGRTIATSLAGDTPTALEDIDYKPAPVLIKADLLSNNQVTANESKSTHVLTISNRFTNVAFNYQLDSIELIKTCLNDTAQTLALGLNPFICEYSLEINVIDEAGNNMLDGPFASPSALISYLPGSGFQETTGINFTVAFQDIGTYTITKTLRIDEIRRQSYMDAYRDALTGPLTKSAQTCVPYNPPLPEGCNTDCISFCAEAYRELYFDQNSNQNEYVYYDNDGVAMAPEADAGGNLVEPQAYRDLVAACQIECEETDEIALNECELKLNLMKFHMSPGGQYFDNLKTKYEIDPLTGFNVVDSTGEPVEDPFYQINGWLNQAFTTFPTNIFPGETNWNDVRANWNATVVPWEVANPDWMDDFVLEHPEYCAYDFNCLRDIEVACDRHHPLDLTTIPRSHILQYDFYMMSGGSNYLGDKQKTKDFVNPSEFLDFLNPLGLANQPSTNPIGADNSSYIDEEMDDPAGANYQVDPLFKNKSCHEFTFVDAQGNENDVYPWMELRLKRFLEVSPGVYHNIWYVMDDKDGIGSLSLADAMSQGVSEDAWNVYQTLHNSSTGILDKDGTNPNKLNKFQFFRGVYKFYRDFILYQLFKEDPEACTNDAGVDTSYIYWNPDVLTYQPLPADPLDFVSYNGVRDHDDLTTTGVNEADNFDLIWRRNLVFDLLDLDDLMGMQNTYESLAATSCDADCDNNAEAWMMQLASCTDGLSDAQLDNIKNDLIEVCQLGCVISGSNQAPIGSSVGDGSSTITPNDGTSTTLMTFDDVIAHYASLYGFSCTKTVVYPNPIPVSPESVSECNCGNLEAYVTGTLALSWPLDDAEQVAVLAGINSLTSPASSFVWEDLERWEDFCNNQIGDIIDLPATLECVDCKCDNLAFYISSNTNYDPYALSLSDAGSIATQIDYEFDAALLSGQEIYDMMLQCVADGGDPQTNPTNDDFVNLPAIFTCNVNLEIRDESLDCATEADLDRLNNYNSQWNLLLGNELEAFYNEYTSTCMDKMDTRETFTAQYQLDEYMYTLYYYDQAGNLIKTVPPEGVKPVETTHPTFFVDVDLHRENSVANPHKNVEHKLVTNYKYDSYNNLIEQTTPDGGTTKFYYDVLGRIVLSQNEKQLFAPGASYVYNYTIYDPLGRITEVGEVETTTEITTAILKKYSQEFLPWLKGEAAYAATIRSQVTQTFYDGSLSTSVEGYFTNDRQEELRTRVASITREEIFDGDNTTYDYGTHYSYDVHGNVKELIQENNYLEITAPSEKLRCITYEYDLISGNVNKVNYQAGEPDQFYHRYCYDADNRITKAETSKDDYIWDTDAKYFYYEHGPLARTEIGEKQVAGSDYAYTLQGWLKGVNSNTLETNRDIGKDAQNGNLNSHFASDAFGYSLGYFRDDYAQITPAQDEMNDFLANMAVLDGASESLYNGNIKHMVNSLLNYDGEKQDIHGKVYSYDQVNRIKSSNVFTDTDITSTNSFVDAFDNGAYATKYTYDLNGNITYLSRKDDAGDLMDSLTYKYANDGNGYNLALPANQFGQDYSDASGSTNTNRLTRVTDTQGSLNGDDIGAIAQYADNYKYDDIGQLLADQSEGIREIVWDTYHKIKEILYTATDRPNLAFKYDGAGNRIAKIIKPKNASTGNVEPRDKWIVSTYDRDASGNILAVNKQTIVHIIDDVYESVNTVEERDIYGSNRLGTDNTPLTQRARFRAAFEPDGGITPITGLVEFPIDRELGPVLIGGDDPVTVSGPIGDNIRFELAALYSDVLIAAPRGYTLNSGKVIDSGTGELILEAGSSIDITVNSSTVRNNNVRINTQGAAARFNTDQTFLSLTSFEFPIKLAYLAVPNGTNTRVIGQKTYEESNHLGNVMVTLSDRKFPTKEALQDIAVLQDNFSNGLNWSPTTATTDVTIDLGRMRIETPSRFRGAVHEITTIPGESYTLTFDYAPGDVIYMDAVVESATGAILFAQGYHGTAGTFTYNFTATTTLSKVKFTAGTPTNYTGRRHFFMDNVNVTYNDLVLCYEPNVKSYADYYPFGSLMPKRNGSAEDYRYGYQGSESDDEIAGVKGSHITTLFRQGDTRLCRWWGIDPKATAHESPYAFMGNNPIMYNDVLGDTIQIRYLDKDDNWAYHQYGKEYTGNSQFVKDVIVSLDAGKEMGGQIEEDINFIQNFEFPVYIQDNELDPGNDFGTTGVSYQSKGYGDTRDHTVRWDSRQGSLHYSNGKISIAPPAVILFHEIGHAKLDLGTSLSDWWNEHEGGNYGFGSFFSKKYDNPEEKYLIKGVESYALELMGLNIRDYHGGLAIEVKSPLSPYVSPNGFRVLNKTIGQAKEQGEKQKSFDYIPPVRK